MDDVILAVGNSLWVIAAKALKLLCTCEVLAIPRA